MTTKISATFLILGLTLSGLWNASSTPPKRTPQSVAPTPPQLGKYSLVNGTDGCPRDIEWNAECHGYTLKIYESDETQKFCNINRGASVSQEKTAFGNKKVLDAVTQKENLIRKNQLTVLVNNSGAVTLRQEDSIVIDETGKFLWEHSANGKGFSCLYSK